MSIVTVFKGFNNPVADKELLDIITEIKSGIHKREIEKIRQAVFRGQLKEADHLKKQLLAFTPCGQFKNGRKSELLIAYSGFVILDLDNLGEQLLPTFVKASVEPLTFCCFKSPRGNGLKIIVRVNSSKEMHERVFSLIADHYEKILAVPVDRCGKDITRLCFVSDDEHAFINLDPVKYTFEGQSFVSSPSKEFQNMAPPIFQNIEQQFQKCIEFTNKKMHYIDGNRNNYIHLLTCNANRAGIQQQETELLIRQSFDLSHKEISSIVSGVFKRQFHQFAQDESNKESVKTDIKESKQSDLLHMPCIPEEIFSTLPELLLHGVHAFKTERERDIFLTGAITILSGCLPEVEGIYDQRVVYPNLNCFIIAPAASGKGAFVFAKALGQAYHNKLLKESNEALKRYNAELQFYKSNQRKGKKGESMTEDEPQRPAFKILFIPGNTSSAAVIRHLMDGDERGIFCETEADTMSNSLKQDWGGYSDLLRKAFQHESISYSRKTNQEYFEINKPRMSVALSGTPAQVQGLIKSAEDGLFSRFIYYSFKVKPEWRDVSPNQERGNLTQHFEMLSNKVLQMVEFLDRYPSTFVLSQEQWDAHNKRCAQWLKEIYVFVSEEATGSVKRLGLITFRIAMTFSAIRKFENGDTSPQITCDEVDFETAFKLSEIYLQHAIYMFGQLPKQGGISDQGLKKLFMALPDSFQRKEAIEVGKAINIEERTTDKYLGLLVKETLLIKAQYGFYSKN